MRVSIEMEVSERLKDTLGRVKKELLSPELPEGITRDMGNKGLKKGWITKAEGLNPIRKNIRRSEGRKEKRPAPLTFECPDGCPAAWKQG